MSISYKKLFNLLESKNMSKTEMRESVKISTSTLAKLSSNRPVTLDILERICTHFNVEIQDIVEFKRDKN